MCKLYREKEKYHNNIHIYFKLTHKTFSKNKKYINTCMHDACNVLTTPKNRYKKWW